MSSIISALSEHGREAKAQGSGKPAGALRIARLLHDSITDGPGLRYTVFAQGCPHRCTGCHNPETHDPAGGRAVAVPDVLADIAKNPLLQGVTLSGGEPFAQASALLPLAEGIRDMGMGLWIYTGYTWERLMEDDACRRLCAMAEVVVDGLYDKNRQSYGLLWRGSVNQRLVDAQRSLDSGRVVEYKQKS